MQLTRESRGTGWMLLALTWGIVATLVLLHTQGVRTYVDMLDSQGWNEAAAPSTPLRQVIPARHADAQMWVRHVLTAEETGAARVRSTTTDNAPMGRDVHWSSAFAWLLRSAGAVQRTVTNDTGSRALERTLLWFNAPLLIGLVIALSSWAWRRAGAGAGILIASAMVGHRRFYESFQPTFVDHHGLINAAVLGLILGVAFMGAGWWRASSPRDIALLPTAPAPARRAAIVSAVCGGLGLWLSAAAVIPVIALLGLAGLGSAWRWGRSAQQDGAVFEPDIWRLWGRVGGATSLACYLIEYAPAHLGLRLEVNHPLHAFAWWGAGELIATLSAWRLSPGGTIRAIAPRLLLPLLAVLAPPFTVLLGGKAVFAVGDPFVGALRHFVAEGRSMPAIIRQLGLSAVHYHLATAVLLIPAAWGIFRARGGSRILLGALTLVCAGLMLMGCAEMRWWQTASAGQIALLVALIATASWRTRWAWIGGGALALFIIPALQQIAVTNRENRERKVSGGDLLQPLYRNVAAALRQSQPDGPITVLANPNAAAGIGYYGRFQTLGTLYWENADGLRAAAEIFSARTEEEALALIKTRKVTHIAMIAAGNFLGEYFQLLHPRASPEEARHTFGFRLAAKQPPPAWLQPILYRRPSDLKDATTSVLLFKVAPSRSELERLYQVAIAQLVDGDVTTAENSLEIAVAQAPAPSKSALYEAGGAAFYDHGADAAALRLFQRGLELTYDPGIANTVAWILATSRDARVRDGRAALALVEPVLRLDPNDATVLSTYAAACAEAGRYAEAVTAAERALANGRAASDAAAIGLLQQRLARYRAQQPWRQ